MRDTWEEKTVLRRNHEGEEPEGEEEVPHRIIIKVFSYETKMM